MVMDYITGIAIAIVSVGFWAQAWRIHRHKEVRDLSLLQYISLATGYLILSFVAYGENSIVFLIKQIASFLPVLVIIAQIIIHREDKWEE